MKHPSEFSKNYFSELSLLFNLIDHEKVEDVVRAIQHSQVEGKSIYIMGNGGSASTASHLANDLILLGREDSISYRVINLTDNNAVMSAIANDFGFQFVFKKQLENVLNEGDLVILISASGNSPNIIEAVKYANSKKAITIGFTGFDGGLLKDFSNLSLHVPSGKGRYGEVEDVHLIFNHIISGYLKKHGSNYGNLHMLSEDLDETQNGTMV